MAQTTLRRRLTRCDDPEGDRREVTWACTRVALPCDAVAGTGSGTRLRIC